jgi:hypothetical protein
MAETITTVLAQPFELSGNYLVTVYDQVAPGGTLANIIASADAGTFRTWLAPSGGTGSAASPRSLTARVRANLGSPLWNVTATGRIIANLLGFTSDVGPLATGTTQTGDYQPTHCAFLYGRTNSTGWQGVPGPMAYAEMPRGEVYGDELGVGRMRTTFDAMGLPTDAAARTALGSVCTQMFPAESRWIEPSATPAVALTPGWSLHEFVRTAGGKRLGVALGTWPQIVAGTTTAYHAANFTAECLAAASAQRLTESGNRLRTDWSGLSLWYLAAETL